MIRTIIHISFLRLWHNKAELLLTFIVPILFFSIFAWIFGSRGNSGATPQLKVVACDEIGSLLTQRTREILEASGSLRFHRMDKSLATSPKAVSREAAESLVRRGLVSAAIVFSSSPSDPSTETPLPTVEIMADSFDQVASQVIVAFVQKASMTAQAEFAHQNASNTIRMQQQPTQAGFLEDGREAQTLSNLTPDETLAVKAAAMSSSQQAMTTSETLSGNLSSISIPQITVIDVLGTNKTNPVVAMYAAGIAVMFLLFSATTASGAILEERENSTLERLLCSRMTMDHLLMGKWCYLVMIGCLQTTLMFTAGWLFFGLNLFGHLDGFAVMTLVTAGAAASFALMMAAMCKTRTQLGWVSTILILSMSALGGSMVPRYLMSETIQSVGQFTFNAWALDGYNKIFWRELPLTELKTELGVLVTCSFVFIVLARIFATRWDRV